MNSIRWSGLHLVAPIVGCYCRRVYFSTRRVADKGLAFAILLLAAQLAVFASLAPSASALTPTELMKKVGPAVVWIKSSVNGTDFISQGSGCNIDTRGMIITNRHVVRGARSILVQFPSGEQYRATAMLHEDSDKDIAIFRINGFGLPVAELGSSSEIEVGAPVVAIGTPRGLENTISTGILSGRRIFNGTSLLQTTAPISEGSSGGPLFDDSGRIVGITTALVQESQNLNFCVPINYVRAAMSALVERPLGPAAPATPSTPPRESPSRRKEITGGSTRENADVFVHSAGEGTEDARARFIASATGWGLTCEKLAGEDEEFIIRRPTCNLICRFSLADDGALDRLLVRIQVRKKPEYAYEGALKDEVYNLNSAYNFGRFWEDENRIYIGTYLPYVDRIARDDFAAFLSWYESAWIALAKLEPDLFTRLQ